MRPGTLTFLCATLRRGGMVRTAAAWQPAPGHCCSGHLPQQQCRPRQTVTTPPRRIWGLRIPKPHLQRLQASAPEREASQNSALERRPQSSTLEDAAGDGLGDRRHAQALLHGGVHVCARQLAVLRRSGLVTLAVTCVDNVHAAVMSSTQNGQSDGR